MTNGAVETIRRLMDFNNSNDVPVPASQQVADDFTYEDHRTGGFNFGRLDASEIDAFAATRWDAAIGRLTEHPSGGR